MSADIDEVKAESQPVILAFGDSLTAGFGVAEKENYPSRLQALLTAEGFSYRVVNGGVSGDTTAGGLRRIHWLLKLNPEIVILELGANDGLRGLALEEMRSNLVEIIAICKKKNAQILLAGMKIPPNYGEEYTKGFEDVFVSIAEEHGLPLIPFFLEGVAAKEEWTRPDGIHPTGDGYKVVAETVWKNLQPMLVKK
jgi:acyl-CoA thioesterase I